MNRSRLVSFLLVFPFAATLAAQEAPPVFEEEIVVTATGSEEPVAEVPASVTVVDRAEIEAREARQATDLLASVPGLTLASVGGPGAATSIFTRGTNSTQTLVLLDGVELNTPYFSGYDVAHFEADSLERVEVVRGPFSALWGADAVGGAINFITRRGSGEPFGGSVTLEGGSDSHRRGSVFLGGEADALSYGLSIFDGQGDGRFEGFDGVAHDSYEARGGALDLHLDLGADVDLGFIAHYRESELRIPFENGFGTAVRADRRQDDDELVLVVPLSQRVSDRWSWSLTLSRVDSEQRFRDPEDSFGFTRSDIASETTTGRMTHDLAFGDHALTVGAEWGRREVDDRDAFGENLAGDGDDNVGFFVQDQWRLGEQVVVHLGLRHDDDETYGSETSPRVALAWIAPSKRTRVHASYGRAFRAPSVGELYYPYFGNRDLEAERSASWEIGLRQRLTLGSAAIELFANGFRNDLEDLIQLDFATFALGNLGEARTEGVELGAEAHVGTRFRAAIDYTYLETEDLATGEALLRRPRHAASLSLGFRPTDWLGLHLETLHVGKRDDVAIDYSRAENDAFTRVDLAATARFSWLEPFVRVENVFDEEYESVLGYPAPERRWVVGARVGF